MAPSLCRREITKRRNGTNQPPYLPAISSAEEEERRGILTLKFDPNIINYITNREFTGKMAKWFTFYFRKGVSICNV